MGGFYCKRGETGLQLDESALLGRPPLARDVGVSWHVLDEIGQLAVEVATKLVEALLRLEISRS